MATLTTTVKVTEGNFTRFNNILSTLTTGDHLDFRQITAVDAHTANVAGNTEITLEHGHWRRRALCCGKPKRHKKSIHGDWGDVRGGLGCGRLTTSSFRRAPPFWFICRQHTSLLSFACEDATDVDLKVYVHED